MYRNSPRNIITKLSRPRPTKNDIFSNWLKIYTHIFFFYILRKCRVMRNEIAIVVASLQMKWMTNYLRRCNEWIDTAIDASKAAWIAAWFYCYRIGRAFLSNLSIEKEKEKKGTINWNRRFSRCTRYRSSFSINVDVYRAYDARVNYAGTRQVHGVSRYERDIVVLEWRDGNFASFHSSGYTARKSTSPHLEG